MAPLSAKSAGVWSGETSVKTGCRNRLRGYQYGLSCDSLVVSSTRKISVIEKTQGKIAENYWEKLKGNYCESEIFL